MLILSRARWSLSLPRYRRPPSSVLPHYEPQAESSTAHSGSSSSSSKSVFLRARLPSSNRHLTTTFVQPEAPTNPSAGSISGENAVSYTKSPTRFSRRQRPRNKTANVTLVNARKLAQQIRQQPSEKSATPIEADEPEDEISHLRLLNLGRELRAFNQSESDQLTDMLKKEPQKPPRHEVWEPEYVKPYKRLYKSIEGAFTTRQLRKLSNELGLKGSYKDNKLVLIHRILEMWGWAQPVSAPQAEKAREAMKEQGELHIRARASEHESNKMIRFRSPRPRALLIPSRHRTSTDSHDAERYPIFRGERGGWEEGITGGGRGGPIAAFS